MKQLLKTTLMLAIVTILAASLATTGCKKQKQAPPPPPPPPPAVVTPPPAPPPPDTTGQGAREEMARMEADRARIQTVYFDYDKSDIRADQRDKIKTNADIFRTWTKWQVSVEGHCDERGTNEYNLALGERRATAAKQALVAEGIDGGRISTISYGEERPLDPGHDESSWARNRRAEFKVR
jgi:peptidoglycan-associated lipoprotein